MLQSFRDKSHGIGSKIFIALIAIVFAVFGLDSLIGSSTTGTVASVNGVEIDEFTLETETQSKTQELLQSLGNNVDISDIDPSLFREAALNDLIQEELLFQAASGAGMRISSKSIDLEIARTEDFQINGVYDNAMAQTLLQSYGYTPSSFRSSLSKDRLLNQLVLAYSASGFVTSLEIEQAAAITLQKRDLRYLLLSRNSMGAGIEVRDEEIEAYYQDKQDDFMQEEQISLEYISLDKNDIFAEVEIQEEAVLAQYELQIEEYESQVERRASHILIEASAEEEFEAAETLLQDLKTRIDAGESFEELALENSNDTGSATDGGDVGFTTGDNFVPEFELALQALLVGEVSDPVRTEFGYHLIKLTDQSSTEFESFEELQDQISRDLREGEVENLYLARAEELNNLAFESLDLDEPADILSLPTQTTELFSRGGGVGIAANSSVINAAFGIDVFEDGLNSELIAVNDSLSVIVRLLEVKPAAILELAEVKGEIEVILRSEKVSERLSSIGETIVASIQNNQNIDGLLETQELSWNQAKGLQRTNTSVNPELTEKVFAMPKPASETDLVVEGFQLDSGDYFVVELQSVISGAMEDFSGEEAEGLQNFITQKTGADDLDAYLAGMRTRATIK